MPLISEEDRQFLVDHFSKELKEQVKVTYFTQRESKLLIPSQECMYCKETREILQEVSELSDKIELEIKDFVGDAEEAAGLGIEKIPATIITGAAKGKVRYYGIPSGYEFATLVESIVDVSKGTTDLSDETRAELAKIDRELHIQVFVTPT
jgi:glutaredoxin-like protein